MADKDSTASAIVFNRTLALKESGLKKSENVISQVCRNTANAEYNMLQSRAARCNAGYNTVQHVAARCCSTLQHVSRVAAKNLRKWSRSRRAFTLRVASRAMHAVLARATPSGGCSGAEPQG